MIRPPTVATWLLRYFGSDPKNESLIGDLIEQYGHGRSRSWYWRQVLTAIVISFVVETWRHKLLAVRAVVTGWASLLLLSTLCRFPPPLTMPLDMDVLDLLASILPAHWLVYRWNYWAVVVLCLVSLGSGFVVASLHRKHRTPMVAAYALSCFLYYLPELHRLITDSMASRIYLPYLVSLLVLMALIPSCILLGGLFHWGGIHVGGND